MADVNEPTSKSDNTIVDSTKDFSDSPHTITKKAYSFTIGKGSNNEYSARLGFNKFKLAEGEFTLVIEFFPSSMDQLSVKIVSELLSIGQQSTKLFPKYSRSIVHLSKYDLTPPEYIHIDMRCQGDKDSPTQGACHLIAYGTEGRQSDVSSDIYRYDVLFVIENNTVKFEAPVEEKDAVNSQKKMFDDRLVRVFFFCGDLVHDNTREVKIATSLTSSSILSDASHFAIVNNDFVVKKSGI